MKLTTVRRRTLAIARRVRMARIIAKALKSSRHPILAQVIPTRRCNLSCTYCSEFDRVSPPVPASLMIARIDRLALLGTSMIDLSGGEPLLHPDLDEIIRRVRQHGLFASLLTNGYLLTIERIRRLNRAGLDRLQISIDNLVPDEVSHKSLKVLDQKLRWLADYAEFDVNINTVLGAGVRHPADALLIARRALELGFGTSVGLIHDSSGTMMPLDAEQRAVHEQLSLLGRGFYSHAHDGEFQRNLIEGVSNAWHCRAGARYLYVCEAGLVHWCSQQRGYPAIPLDEYGPAAFERDTRRRSRARHSARCPACTAWRSSMTCVRGPSTLSISSARPTARATIARREALRFSDGCSCQGPDATCSANWRYERYASGDQPSSRHVRYRFDDCGRVDVVFFGMNFSNIPGSAISFSIASISIGTNDRQVLVAGLGHQDDVFEPDVDAILGDRQRRLDGEHHAGHEHVAVRRVDVVDFHADGVSEAAARRARCVQAAAAAD